MAAAMRVRQSPFGNAPPPSGGGGGGFGAPQAPGPSPPGSMGVAAPAPENVSFDWMEQDFGTPAPAPQAHNSVSHPSPQQYQQPQQQFYQQQQQTPPARQQQPFQQQQHQQFSQPHPGGGQSPSPMPFNNMQGSMGVNGSNLLASGMGAMGMNSMMAGMMANGLANEFEGRAGQAIGWFPALFFGLQQLFRVGHGFVLRKMLLLLCPFVKRAPAENGSLNGGWGDESQQQSSPVDHEGLKTDIEEADLYIPSMACMTYVLLYGVQRAMLKDFSPEVLSTTFSFALVLFILEVGAFYMAFYFAGSPMAPLQIVANAGYKYFHVLLMVLLRMVAGSSFIYYIFFTYLAACSGWSVRRFMLKIEPSQLRQQYGVPASSLTRHIIDAMGIAQVPICWLLTPSAS
mmetsp:Transcript_29491/g.63883  ORF Transcript_29491/g.63883 Transcript_29491/m.63883 type:complete len:400 (-) Transcript_29491:108-1307(-)